MNSGILRFAIWLIAPAFLLYAQRLFEFGADGFVAYSDPDWNYFMNFLRVAVGDGPNYIFHPGIPLQLLGGGFVWLWHKWHFADGVALAEQALRHPEPYIKACSDATLALSALTTVGAAAWVQRLSRTWAWAALLPLAWISQQQIMEFSARLTPETHEAILALALGLLLFHHAKKGSRSFSVAALAGAIVALGIATKSSFFPMALMLLALRSRRERALAVVALFGVYFLCVAAVGPQRQSLFEYIFGMARHDGYYGAGEPRVFPPLERMLRNVAYLWDGDRTTFYPLLYAAALTPLAWWNRGEAGARFFLVSLVTSLAGFVVVVKHPASRYLVPYLALLPVAFFALAESLAHRGLRLGVTIATGALVLLGIAHARYPYESNRAAEEEIRLQRATLEAHAHCATLIPAGAHQRLWAMVVGNAMAARWNKDLERLYPRTFFVEYFGKNTPTYFNYTGERTLANLQQVTRDAGCLVVLHPSGIEEKDRVFLRWGKTSRLANESVYLVEWKN